MDGPEPIGVRGQQRQLVGGPGEVLAVRREPALELADDVGELGAATLEVLDVLEHPGTASANSSSARRRA